MYRIYVYNFKFYTLLILVQKVVTTHNEQLVGRTFHLLHKNPCNQSEFPQHLRLLISGESKFGMNKTPMCVTWDINIYFFKKKHRINDDMTLPETNSEFTPEKSMGIISIPFLSFFGWPYISENECNCCFENIN